MRYPNFVIDNPGGKTSFTFRFMTYKVEGREYCYVDELYIYADTSAPTTEPTRNPTTMPTAQPSIEPTFQPTAVPSVSTYSPTINPLLQSQEPSSLATTEEPTNSMWVYARKQGWSSDNCIICSTYCKPNKRGRGWQHSINHSRR